MLRRYLRLNGPATLADYTWWAGGEPSWSRPIWGGLEAALAEVTVEGRRGWLLEEDMEEALAPVELPQLQLLGPFDPYVLGHQDRGHIIDPEHRSLVSRAAGWISAVVLRRGRVVGVWTQRKARGRIAVEVRPFARLDPSDRRLLEGRVESLAGFAGAPCDLIVA